MGVPEEWPSSLRQKQFWREWTEPGLQAVWHLAYSKLTDLATLCHCSPDGARKGLTGNAVQGNLMPRLPLQL